MRFTASVRLALLLSAIAVVPSMGAHSYRLKWWTHPPACTSGPTLDTVVADHACTVLQPLPNRAYSVTLDSLPTDPESANFTAFNTTFCSGRVAGTTFHDGHCYYLGQESYMMSAGGEEESSSSSKSHGGRYLVMLYLNGNCKGAATVRAVDCGQCYEGVNDDESMKVEQGDSGQSKFVLLKTWIRDYSHRCPAGAPDTLFNTVVLGYCNSLSATTSVYGTEHYPPQSTP